MFRGYVSSAQNVGETPDVSILNSIQNNYTSCTTARNRVRRSSQRWYVYYTSCATYTCTTFECFMFKKKELGFKFDETLCRFRCMWFGICGKRASTPRDGSKMQRHVLNRAIILRGLSTYFQTSPIYGTLEACKRSYRLAPGSFIAFGCVCRGRRET